MTTGTKKEAAEEEKARQLREAYFFLELSLVLSVSVSLYLSLS